MADGGWIRGLAEKVSGLGSGKSPPARAQVGGPLDDLNDDFHDTYEGARQHARHDAPVFVVLADQLILFYRGQRSAFDVLPRAYHVIKSVSHAPLAIFATYEQLDRDALDQSYRDKLAAQRERFVQSLARLDQDAAELAPRVREDLRLVLQSSIDFVDQSQPLDEFARAVGPVLVRLIDDATGLQLDALHEKVEQALEQLAVQDLAHLQVVVTGNHQARERSIGMQYFQKRLREPEDHERRVTYGEGVNDEAAALALVGTRRLDHAISEAFFGDAQRMQRDLLGDAAKARLETFEMRMLD